MEVLQADSNGEILNISHTWSGIGRKKLTISDNIVGLSCAGSDSVKNQLVKIDMYGSRLSSIPDDSYSGCYKLTETKFSTNLKQVGDRAFKDCESLKSVSILNSTDHIVYVLGESAFENTGIESIVVSLSGSSFDTYFGYRCFADCKNLRSVYLAKSTYLADNMFEGCSSLKSVTLNNYHSYVGKESFKDCTNLQQISFPQKTWMIGDGEFIGCTSLNSVEFQGTDQSPSQLQSVGDDVFSGCTSLTTIKLPKSLNNILNIGENFLRGSSLTKIYLNGLDDDQFSGLASGDSTATTVSIRAGTVNIYTSTTKMDTFSDLAMSIARAGGKLVVIGGNDGCPKCDNYQLQVTSSSFKTYVSSKNLYVIYHTGTGGYETARTILSKLNREFNMSRSSSDGTFPYQLCFWHDTAKNKSYSRWDNNASVGGINAIQKFFDKYGDDSGSGTGASTTSEYKMNAFGLTHDASFFSSTGKEYKFTYSQDGSSIGRYESSTDGSTTSDFKTGTWYSSAKELKSYADEHNIPVFLKIGSDACGPCEDFNNTIYNNEDFDKWVKASKYLYCKYDAIGNFGFKKPGTQEYFILNEWTMAPEKTIPQLMCYWRKSDGTVVRDVWVYTYGSITYQGLEQRISSNFKGYN